MKTEEKLGNIIQDVLQIDPVSIKGNLLFVDYPNWDSMNFMLFIMDIERILGINLTNEEIIEMNSFNKAVEIINRKI